MAACGRCKKSIRDGEEREFGSETLCDDCYIDAIWPRVRKTYYANDPAEFMRRLKDSYSIRPQQYH